MNDPENVTDLIREVMDNWSDEEIDAYLAIYGKGVCD